VIGEADRAIAAIELDVDGSVLVAGAFTTLAGSPRTGSRDGTVRR